ncbi:abhydrolase domain containing Hydr1 [Arctopsyche grandis]|uniref:abhydrolase domain containing Hydr1 n=1 Tax=Arctopsyche grandis TaxID=121162 RepID=UPI00406D92FE
MRGWRGWRGWRASVWYGSRRLELESEAVAVHGRSARRCWPTWGCREGRGLAHRQVSVVGGESQRSVVSLRSVVRERNALGPMSALATLTAMPWPWPWPLHALAAPRDCFLAFALAGFVAYYLLNVVKRPTLVCRPGPFRDFLVQNVQLLDEKFWPTLWCFESRLQTIIASVLRTSILADIQYRREILKLADGGEVALDWMDKGCAKNSPIVIILPGLTGGSQAEYIKCLVNGGVSIGIRCVIFNNRGLGGMELKTPRLYCAANYEDLAEVVKHVQDNHPNVPVGATGISMGGLILGNYLAGQGKNSGITAAMIISVPWNVFKGSESIEKPYLNNLLCRHLAGSLVKTIEKCEPLRQAKGQWDFEEIMQSKTVRDFDTAFTSKHFGYKDVWDYYGAASLHDKLHKMNIPVLCLNAADDPFQPLEAIPVEEASNSEHVAIVITARGGHIGFMEGFWPPREAREQYMARLFSQYFTAIFRDESVTKSLS